MASLVVRSRTFKNARQKQSFDKRIPILEDEEPWSPWLHQPPRQNPYKESLKDARTNVSQHKYSEFPAQIFEIPKSILKKLRKICVPEQYKMRRASVYGRDGTNQGYMPNIRQCYRYTYNQGKHPVKCKRVTNIFKKIIDKEFGSYCFPVAGDASAQIKIEESHFDILIYNKKNNQPDGFFLPHRDSVKERQGYTQFAVILCLDSHITSINAGATEIYHNRDRHIFKETTEPGKAIIFPAHAFHGSVELKNIGDVKNVLKFDVHIPNGSHFDTSSLNRQCKCENCKQNSAYNKMITDHSVFHGKHQILPREIINQIGDFRGEFLKCSCPYARKSIALDGSADIPPCTCGCFECYGWCKHHPFSPEDQDDDYYTGMAYDFDDGNYCNGWCNGDD